MSLRRGGTRRWSASWRRPAGVPGPPPLPQRLVSYVPNKPLTWPDATSVALGAGAARLLRRGAHAGSVRWLHPEPTASVRTECSCPEQANSPDRWEWPPSEVSGAAGPRSLFLASLRDAIPELRRRSHAPAAPDARGEGGRSGE